MIAVPSSPQQFSVDAAMLRRVRSKTLPAPYFTALDSATHEAIRCTYRQARAPPASALPEDNPFKAMSEIATEALTPWLVKEAGGAPPPLKPSASLPEGPVTGSIPACSSMPVLPWGYGIGAVLRRVVPPSPELRAHVPGVPSSSTLLAPGELALPSTVMEVASVAPSRSSSFSSESCSDSDADAAAAAEAAAQAAHADAATVAATVATATAAVAPMAVDEDGGVAVASAAASDTSETPLAPSAEWLRRLFDECVSASAAAAPGSPAQLIAYDASDCPETRRAGPYKVRLDARRGKKPNPQAAALAADPSTDPNATVRVATPVDPSKFNFTKVAPGEVLAAAELAGRRFLILPNKFPVAARHLLVVDAALSPQLLDAGAVEAVAELLAAAKPFSASFNSWGAASSINHLHVHLTDEALAVERFAAEQAGTDSNGAPVFALRGFPARHRAFAWTDAAGREALVTQLAKCALENVPYNVCFSSQSGLAVVFGRTLAQPEVSWKTYGERLGGFEMAGIFTAYQAETYAKLNEGSIAAMLEAGTAPLPEC